MASADGRAIRAQEKSRISHVGGYRRVLPVTLEGMFENTLDWEHLPWQHASTFSAIDCHASGEWGWRATVTATRTGVESLIELRFDRSCGRWITTNLDGPNVGAEIWTQVWPRGEQEIEVIIDFFVPGVPPEQRERVGAAYARQYERLYDEDESMMVDRHRELHREPATPAATIELGPIDDLTLPVNVQWQRREWILEADPTATDQVTVRPTRCPHQLGPLERRDGQLFCPWHGYRFDADTGECLTGHSCRLPSPPTVTVTDGQLRVGTAD